MVALSLNQKFSHSNSVYPCNCAQTTMRKSTTSSETSYMSNISNKSFMNSRETTTLLHRSYQPHPDTTRFLKKKWDAIEYNTHRRRVIEAKSVVDNQLPKTYHSLLHIKTRKVELEEKRAMNIARENQVNLQRCKLAAEKSVVEQKNWRKEFEASRHILNHMSKYTKNWCHRDKMKTRRCTKNVDSITCKIDKVIKRNSGQ